MTKEKSEKTVILQIMGTVLAIGIILTNTQSIYGLLSTVYPINTTGIIASANIQVYLESACINEVSSINWGTLNPGGSIIVTLYVKNTGDIPLTLEMNNDNWNPEGSDIFFTFTWDYSVGELQPSGVLPVTLTLTVSQLIQGITNFSFDVIIIGTQVQ